jgi:hypothetical protein
MLTTIINYYLNTFIVQATVNGSRESLLKRKETGNPYLGEGTRESLLKVKEPGNPYLRVGVSASDLLVLTSSDQFHLSTESTIFLFYKTSYLSEEANRTEPFLSEMIPWMDDALSRCQ